jgi:hypothetical protein
MARLSTQDSPVPRAYLIGTTGKSGKPSPITAGQRGFQRLTRPPYALVSPVRG